MKESAEQYSRAWFRQLQQHLAHAAGNFAGGRDFNQPWDLRCRFIRCADFLRSLRFARQSLRASLHQAAGDDAQSLRQTRRVRSSEAGRRRCRIRRVRSRFAARNAHHLTTAEQRRIRDAGRFDHEITDCCLQSFR